MRPIPTKGPPMTPAEAHWQACRGVWVTDGKFFAWRNGPYAYGRRTGEFWRCGNPLDIAPCEAHKLFDFEKHGPWYLLGETQSPTPREQLPRWVDDVLSRLDLLGRNGSPVSRDGAEAIRNLLGIVEPILRVYDGKPAPIGSAVDAMNRARTFLSRRVGDDF